MQKILLAEDEKDVRDFLSEALTDHGFRVTAVANGAEAVTTAVDEQFDLYLLDMLMPGLDGIQATKVLRKVTPGVPVLGLTGHVGRGYMAQASAYGVTCIAKPVRLDELVAEINDQLSRRPARSAAI
jgi:DNA-binding response OmpR family regulator